MLDGGGCVCGEGACGATRPAERPRSTGVRARSDAPHEARLVLSSSSERDLCGGYAARRMPDRCPAQRSQQAEPPPGSGFGVVGGLLATRTGTGSRPGIEKAPVLAMRPRRCPIKGVRRPTLAGGCPISCPISGSKTGRSPTLRLSDLCVRFRPRVSDLNSAECPISATTVRFRPLDRKPGQHPRSLERGCPVSVAGMPVSGLGARASARAAECWRGLATAPAVGVVVVRAARPRPVRALGEAARVGGWLPAWRGELAPSLDRRSAARLPFHRARPRTAVSRRPSRRNSSGWRRAVVAMVSGSSPVIAAISAVVIDPDVSRSV